MRNGADVRLRCSKLPIRSLCHIASHISAHEADSQLTIRHNGGGCHHEVQMTPREDPQSPDRTPSEAENAMAANARSRDQQGKAADHERRERHIGMMGDGTEEQDLGQPGDPAARTSQSEVEEAFRPPVAPEDRSISEAREDSSADERAVDEGMGEPRNRSGGPSARS